VRQAQLKQDGDIVETIAFEVQIVILHRNSVLLRDAFLQSSNLQ